MATLHDMIDCLKNEDFKIFKVEDLGDNSIIIIARKRYDSNRSM